MAAQCSSYPSQSHLLLDAGPCPLQDIQDLNHPITQGPLTKSSLMQLVWLLNSRKVWEEAGRTFWQPNHIYTRFIQLAAVQQSHNLKPYLTSQLGNLSSTNFTTCSKNQQNNIYILGTGRHCNFCICWIRKSNRAGIFLDVPISEALPGFWWYFPAHIWSKNGARRWKQLQPSILHQYNGDWWHTNH